MKGQMLLAHLIPTWENIIYIKTFPFILLTLPQHIFYLKELKENLVSIIYIFCKNNISYKLLEMAAEHKILSTSILLLHALQ